MSSKINVIEIIKSHIFTLKQSGATKLSIFDLSTFFGIPFIVVAFSISNDFDLSESLTSLLVNFGAIFTALLLSVLVLIYDQENKLDDLKERIGLEKISNYEIKKQLLSELYSTICYCIISSMSLVFVAIINSVIKTDCIPYSNQYISFQFDLNTDIFSPICIFIAINLALTIIMIVKRLHVLLTTD